jgi:hypothetical protein
VDRHRLDADSDPDSVPDFHIDADASGSYPKFFTCRNISNSFLYIFTAVSVYIVFIFLVSVIIANIFDSILTFSGKKI